MKWILTVLLVLSSQTVAQTADGQIKTDTEGARLAWDVTEQQWVTLEQFWLNYAQRRGGLTWGRGNRYPPYDQVSELDTFLVETEYGPCLMEFFHTRWRRANDVRRWDPAFNEYAGCPHVFE